MNKKSNEPKKEKESYGFMDFTENTEKWMKVLIAAAILLVISLIGSRIYSTYVASGCGDAGCAKTESEELEIVENKIGSGVLKTGQEVFIAEDKYELYRKKEANEPEYLLVKWEPVLEKGNKIGTTVEGISEKELIPTGEEGKYLYVWGALEEKLTVSVGTDTQEEYNKKKTEVKILEITAQDSEKIMFE